ncbi:MAG: hypothetical protein HKN26_11115 [Acidimicrobiales bacterium]|nr:hypothetical protein [Acidimicrobiales bacterium]
MSFAALLLEISYTRVISFKLYYYYTYLVIGLALLGIGSGAVFVAVSARLRAVSTKMIMGVGSLLAAASVLLGFVVIAALPIHTALIWEYGTAASYKNVAVLGLLCFMLFATFLSIGVMISTLFGRGAERIDRLYFADLIGAGLACVVAVFLQSSLGPPASILLAGLILAVTGLWIVRDESTAESTAARALGGILAVGLAVLVAAPGLIPDIRTEDGKPENPGDLALESGWGPVFRVDVEDTEPAVRLIYHDGLIGSGIYRFDGDLGALTRFDDNFRRMPFDVLEAEPRNELIIGAAGGHEILASLYFGAESIDAVELNPVTHKIVTDTMADYSGNLADQPGVSYVLGDGRSFLARQDKRYDLIWFVAPDSYAANNAASSGAFVLSESYLYTEEMILDALEHLSDDGIVVAQFGEFVFDEKPNRTARYAATARSALEELGVDDHRDHLMVATTPSEAVAPLSTIIVKRTPFTADEVDRFLASVATVPSSVPQAAPNRVLAAGPVNQVIDLDGAELAAFYDSYPYEVSAITDDSPFFWHFTGFGDVLSNIFDPIDRRDPEDSVGERVLLLLLGFSAIFAAVFLLLPFVAIREAWRELPAKRSSALYFATLGLGFMFFEITMIQKLTLFLGFPTYSLTVTLAAILIFTGIGALLSGRFTDRSRSVTPALWLILALLTGFYQWGLTPLTEALLPQPLAVRIAVSFLVLAPLGLILGAFMPFGLHAVAGLSSRSDEYVAWAWAINGFFSVIGSVLTTILSMTFGFRTVLFAGLTMYAFAVVILRAFAGQPVAETPALPDPLELDLDGLKPAPTAGSPA